MSLVSVSFHQSCPSFDGIRSFVSRRFCWCVSDVNSFHREYRLNTPTFLWDYSHIVPLNQIEVTSETWTLIVYNLVFSGANGVMQDLHYVVHVLLIDSFLARAVNFSLGSLSTNWKYPHSQSASWNDFRGPSVQALPHPLRVSLARARSLFRLLLPSACYAGYIYFLLFTNMSCFVLYQCV